MTRRAGAPAALLLALALLGGITGCAADRPDSAAAAVTPPAAAPSAAVPETAPAALVMSPSPPVRVAIPAIGVDSELMDLGLQADGTMEVPAEGFPAGWFTGAPTPGELGPAVLAGHVDWGGSPGVFARLRDVVPEDEIWVTRADGSTAVFVVREVGQFDKGAFPTGAVYGDLDHAGLRVITCGGPFDPELRSYRDNVVVVAEPGP